MSAVPIEHAERVEQLVRELTAELQERYPHVTAEVVYDPPDGADAWLMLPAGLPDDEADLIAQASISRRGAALERDGVLVLVI
jgi:hypothetical protein